MDVLDEVAAGGRLTRSLRKRLTSIDSEASLSRPNTPIGSKLNSINEQNSPPRSTRMTRRNSVTNLAGTPAKTPSKTPSKTISSRTVAPRLDSTSELNSPMRRVTRRRSASVTEDEETTSVKSVPKVEAVTEEESSTSKRVTRSASKSPLQQITNGEHVKKTSPKAATRPKRAAKAEPKSKTKPVAVTTELENNVNSDVEVIELETDDEETEQTDDKSIDAEKIEAVENEIFRAVEKASRKNSKKTPPKKIKFEKSPTTTTKKKTPLIPKTMQKFETEYTESDTETVIAKEKNQSTRETVINETINKNKNKSMVESEETSFTSTKANLELSPIVIDGLDNAVSPEQLTSSKNYLNSAACVTDVINLRCLSPELINRMKLFENKSPDTKETNIPEKLKTVGFNDSIEDDAAKTCYPKTPGSTKTKSYIELDSSREADKDNSFQALCISDSIEMVEQEISKEKPIRLEQTDATHMQGQSTAKLKIIQSSTTLHDDVLNTSSNEEEFIQLNKNEASPLKSPRKSLTSLRKSIIDSPSPTSLAKSPTNQEKSISFMEEMKEVPLATTVLPSEFEQKSPEKLTSSPNTSLAKKPENLRPAQKSPCAETSINNRQSLEAALQKPLTVDKKKDTNSDSSEEIQMPKKSPHLLELSKKKSLDTSLQSPVKMVLRNSSQKMQSPKISTSMKSPEKQKSPNKSMSPKKATETVASSTEKMQSDEPSSTYAATELNKDSPRATPAFALSWNPIVSGVANNSKIDQIQAEKEKAFNAESDEVNNTLQGSAIRCHRSRFESDDDDVAFDDDNDEYRATEADEELAENEKSHEKHAFIFGEAMEVDDDYQSGDSMDSEERREMENNEIPCDVESLGSDDTDDDSIDEDDEENASFIADDSNEGSLLHYSDDDDVTKHLQEVERKNEKNLKKKRYRRILTVSDDDDDDDDDVDDDDDDDDDDESDAIKDDDGEDDNKSNNSEGEDIGTLIESIGQIVNEDKDSGGDENGVVEKNIAKTSRRGILNRSQTSDIKPVKEKNNVSHKEKRTSLNTTKSTEEPAEEQSSKQQKNSHKIATHDEDHKSEDHEDEVQEDENHENEDQQNENDDHKEDENKRNDNLNSSKLSETTLRLQVFDTDEESSMDQENNDKDKKTPQTQKLDASSKKIMMRLQQSERFNKTVHDFRLDKSEEERSLTEVEETTDTTNVNSKSKRRAASLGSSKIIEQRRSHRLQSKQHHRSKEAEAAAAACSKTSSGSSSEDESHQSTENQMYHTLLRYSLGRSQEKVNKQESDLANKTQIDSIKRRSCKAHEKIKSDEEKEFIAINGDDDSDTASEANTDEHEDQLEKRGTKKKQSNSSAPLSVSLGYIKERHDESTPSRKAHSSFTIGVVVRNNCKNRSVTPEPIATSESSSNGDDDANRKAQAETLASDIETEVAIFSSAEEESPEKLEHTKNVSLSVGLNSSAVYTKQTTEAITDFKSSSKQRRTICIPADYGDFTTSQSFIESVAAESKGEFVTNQTSIKRKRLSKSFCAGASLDTTELEEVHHLKKKSKLAGNDIEINNSSTPRVEEKKNIEEKNTERKNIGEDQIEQNITEKVAIAEKKKAIPKNYDMKQRVLSRCEEILEAANRAKLEAKLNSNKSKVKLLKKKKSKKLAKVQEQQPQQQKQQHQQQQQLKLKEENELKIKENDVQITQKQLKRQERTKLEIEKALKASANIIFNKTEKKVIQNTAMQSKTVLDEFCNAEPVESKESKIKHFLPSKTDKNIVKTSAGKVLEMHLVEKKKKIRPIEEIQLSTGTVRVEPVTPKKVIRSGFRESPITPLSLGFKVRHILSAGQDTPPVIPAKERKRKRNVSEEPSHTLPKPQWTQSGVFIEEEIYASAPITAAGSTKFIVSALNGVRKKKKILAKAGGTAVARSLGSSTVNSSALQFKNNALFRDDIRRETSRELIQRKQRKNF